MIINKESKGYQPAPVTCLGVSIPFSLCALFTLMPIFHIYCFCIFPSTTLDLLAAAI